MRKRRISDNSTTIFPRVGALAVVIEGDRVLLVRRGADKPDAGLWGFPGGHVEAGETVHAAALRELSEETCLSAQAVETLMCLDLIRHDAAGALLFHYLLIAVRCTGAQGALMACDDAAAAEWHLIADVLSQKIPLSTDVDTVIKRALGRG
ncbi:NUDIX hydrolase [Phaeobacter sp. J2-8]|uniref:NUDIX hydrolase n=1 Tax=Phaeobacter sp. J2-8 TaxID=2931394 RepID=UPI001FD50DAB|nr:NUDIX hydrolase [Phaeobacter sp. J2-8]MCJ7874903.1 NUDIX hydrolase [Phaeobacter sp. J2-8]